MVLEGYCQGDYEYRFAEEPTGREAPQCAILAPCWATIGKQVAIKRIVIPSLRAELQSNSTRFVGCGSRAGKGRSHGARP